MNGPKLAGGAHCSGRGAGGFVCVRLLPHPATPLGRPGPDALPPPSLGARRGRGLGRKEPGKGGVGAGRRGVGDGEGGSGGPASPAPGRGPAVWPGLVSPCLAPLQPPTRCGSEGVRDPRYTGRSLPEGGARLALIGAGGGGGGGSWRAARFPLETQSFCSRRRRRRGGLAAWGSRSGWEARGGLGPLSSRGPRAGVGVGGGLGLGGAVSPPWGRLAPPHPACPRGTHPCLAPRHFAVRREMPSTFPLSLRPLDCQMRLCASLGVFSTAPFLPCGQG